MDNVQKFDTVNAPISELAQRAAVQYDEQGNLIVPAQLTPEEYLAGEAVQTDEDINP